MLRINTSNSKKRDEFKRLFQDFGYSGEFEFTDVDLEEIEAEPEQVAAMKASMIASEKGTGILVEDTSLDIEGLDNHGVDIRWLLENEAEFKKHIGKTATFRTILAFTDEKGEIYISKGEVKGIVSERKTAPAKEDFGFDPFFIPLGKDQTLFQHKPNEYNSRAIAVKNYLHGNIEKIHLDEKPVAWQKHSRKKW